MIGTQERSRIAGRLRDAVRRSQQNRWLRGISQPWRAAYPKLLRVTRSVREVHARTFFGPTMSIVLPEHVSTSIWLHGFVSEDVCLMLLATLSEGGSLIDVGAHVGFFALLGAYLAGEQGQVLALEPTPSVYRILQRNVAVYRKIKACPLAAFSEDRELILHDFGLEFSAYNSLLGIRPPEGRRPTSKVDLTVRARRIDDLMADESWDRLDVVKIDAESSEGHVLQGAERTIRRFRPAVIVEVGDCGVGGSWRSREIVAWFVERGFAAFDVQGGVITPHRIRERYEYANVLFIPQERVGRFVETAWVSTAGHGGSAG